MKWIWPVFCLIVISYSEKINKSCECGIEGQNRRIVGGTTVQPHQYPWLVSLMLGPKLHCGGAIITDLHVLTAGHCITFGIRGDLFTCRFLSIYYDVQSVVRCFALILALQLQLSTRESQTLSVHFKDLTVNIGMHDRLGNSFSTYKVADGIKHPHFTSNAVRDINDIAVLTMDRTIKFGDTVRPICLPNEDMDFKRIGLTVAGWGKTRQGALTSSRYLLETKVQIVESNTCQKSSIYKDNLVSDTMMCAYSLGKDACQGDSGGPLFSPHQKTHNKKWYQVGIVSWGIDCAMPDYPGVYTIVAKYISWIHAQTKDGSYCV